MSNDPSGACTRCHFDAVAEENILGKFCVSHRHDAIIMDFRLL